MSASSEEYFNFKATGFADKLSLYVRALFESKQNCDSLIVSENDGKVRAHRLILDATIPGLTALTHLQNDTGNNYELNGIYGDRNAMFVYRLPFQTETITKIVKFCYTGEMSIAKGEVIPLLMFAIKYNVKLLIDGCVNRLKQSIDPDGFKQIVDRLNSTNVASEQRIWREIICSNFLKVSKCPTFGLITMEQFVNIIRSPDLRNIREEDVFNAFLLWLEKPNNVGAHLDIGTMLTYIRFPLMNLKKLLEQFNRNDLVAEYFKWNHPQGKLMDTTTKFSNERMSLRENDLIVLSHNTNNKLVLQIVSPQLGKPTTRCEIAELQFSQHESVTSTNDGKLAISGGVDKHNKVTSTIISFDLETMEKMECPALQLPRSSAASIVINNDIYVAGGMSSGNVLNSVEKYCYISRKCSFVKSMVQKRMEFFLVAVNGNVYALGGREWSNRPMLNSVERYSPSLDTWTVVAPMAYSRAGLSAVAHNNSIYVFGGAQKMKREGEKLFFSDFTNKVEQYNVVTDSWSTIYTLDIARIGIISCLYGEHIILIGGCDEKKKENAKTIQIFDTERLECIHRNSLKECVSYGVAFPAPIDLVEKLKEQQIGTTN